MPTTPLAHTPLLFLDDVTMPLDRGPFGIRPFTNNHFRLLCGLRPIQDAEDMAVNTIDIRGKHDEPPQYCSLSDGFVLSNEGRAILKPKDRSFFTDSAWLSHGEYLTQALKYASQHREAIENSMARGKGKGKGKGNSQKGEDDNGNSRSCISSATATKISGHTMFKGAILAMYNRPDGVMARIADIMKRTSRSPVHVWRDMASEQPQTDPYSLSVKSSKGILHELTTQVCLELFGASALTTTTRVPRSTYKSFIQGVLNRVWATRKVVSMTEDAMDRAHAAYVELHFPPQKEAVEEVTEGLANAMSAEDEASVDLLAGTQGSDIGVAEYANKSLDEMFRLLGLVKTRKIPFTSDELKVEWHQMVAIAANIKAMFTKNLGDHGQPKLLCDEVGLGKTAEIIGTICILAHLIELQQRKEPLIPLLTESEQIYFDGGELIPLLPSILLMSKSLCIQWGSQFKRFTTPGSFRLIDYSKKGEDRISYFAKGGGYDEHVTRAAFPQRVVFLCTFTSIGTEAGETLARAPRGAAGRELRFRGEPPTISTHKAPDNTIFAKKFLYFGVDELHQLRNASAAQDGATRLSCNSRTRLGATASPVFTGIKDATAGGIILRIPAMIGDEGYALGYELLELERSRLKEWKALQSKPEPPESVLAPNFDDTPKEQDRNDIASAVLKGSDPRGYKALFIQQPSIEIVRKLLTPFIIRRTSKSRTPDGKLILNVPDYIKSIVWIDLTEVERRALEDLYNRLMSERPDGLHGEMLLTFGAFLIDYKHVLFHPLMRTENSIPLEHFWELWTLQNLREMALSKLLVTLDILEHYKDPSAQPLFFNRDGTRDLERETNFVPPPSPQTPNKPRKILIFIMYDRHTQVTKFMLDLCEHKYLEYNGNKSDVERNRAIKEFETRDDIHVMLLSNVGTTGLNLAMFSVLIFLSGLWSGQEIKQTIGRVVRPGQLLVAHIYHIMAPNTADEILSGYATSKAIMEDALFVQKKELATKIFHNVDTDDEDSETERPAARARSTVTPRVLKQKQVAGTAQPVPLTKEQAKSKKRKAPAAPQSSGDATEQATSGSQPKRRKVSAKDSNASVTQPQPLSSETGSVQIPASQDEVVVASKPKLRPRPRMRPRPG